MALSMDEQRMLAEIERRLAAEDPGLATRLSSFRRPGPASVFRSPRARIIASLFTVALVAVISLMVYAMVPFRAHMARLGSRPQATPAHPALTVPAGTKSGSSAPAATHTSGTATGRTAGKAGKSGSGTASRGAKPPGTTSAIGSSPRVTLRSASA
ncbi:MAG: DUF3040 domain-containing protein, partial [Streptosporangiaceae bacterium]|nr:DUF3040 domain-containing protein [Streptosporangiaceae bacterium]